MADSSPVATLRIAVITAVQASVGRRVQTNATDTAWIPRSEDTSLAVGDRVWLLQQGATFVVGGRLSGEPGAVPLGAVMSFAGATAPDGWLACDGAAVSRTTYAGLFAVMGTGYGVGDGSTTFNLPDLRERVPVGTGPGRARAATGGAATVALSTANLPAHDHSSAGNHAHGLSNIGGVFVTAGGAVAALASTAATWVTDAGGTHTHSSVGSGTAHENMMPFQVLLYCVRAL
jgi:microcystin-dependent protein